MRKTAGKRLRLMLVAAALAVFAVSCIKQGSRVAPTLTSSETPQPVAVKASDSTFQAFSHTVPEHKQFDCTSCHKREGKSLKIDYPGHEACIGCHLNQFTDVNAATMCSICHQNVGGDPNQIKAFPAKFVEGFNMKFDHAAHERGEARPSQGCVACHDLAGPGRHIPVGYEAHNDCFGCHTADKKVGDKNIGECSVCHEIAPYSRTPQSRYVFKAVFTHAAHSGVGCADCHNVREGRQGAQVTNIVAQEHKGLANSCQMCHNGQRAFNGNNMLEMTTCTRCHKGPSFNMLPN